MPRDDIFLTTKVPHDEATADAVEQAAEESLERLGVDRIDLLLLHWPSPDVPLEETLGAMARLREDGRSKEIGVSNFPAGLLRWLLEQPGVSPIPKASSHGRRLENFDVFDFVLSDDERAEIDRLPKDVRTADPPWAPDWDA